MARRWHLLTALLSCLSMSVAVGMVAAPANAAGECTVIVRQTTGCPTSAGTIRGDGVELTAGHTTPGTTPGAGGTRGPSRSNGGSNIPVLAAPAKPQGSIAPRDG
jgi:hypothetical protein